jgi:hypothetical protein
MSVIDSRSLERDAGGKPASPFPDPALSLARVGGRRKSRELQIEQGEVPFPGLNPSFKVKQDGAAVAAESRRISRLAQVRFECLDQNLDLFAARLKLISHAILPPARPLARRPIMLMERRRRGDNTAQLRHSRDIDH